MKITRKQIGKMNRKISRDLEYEWHTGWVQTHKTHKSKKSYNQKSQSWKEDWDSWFGVL